MLAWLCQTLAHQQMRQKEMAVCLLQSVCCQWLYACCRSRKHRTTRCSWPRSCGTMTRGCVPRLRLLQRSKKTIAGGCRACALSFLSHKDSIHNKSGNAQKEVCATAGKGRHIAERYTAALTACWLPAQLTVMLAIGPTPSADIAPGPLQQDQATKFFLPTVHRHAAVCLKSLESPCCQAGAGAAGCSVVVC